MPTPQSATSNRSQIEIGGGGGGAGIPSSEIGGAEVDLDERGTSGVDGVEFDRISSAGECGEGDGEREIGRKDELLRGEGIKGVRDARRRGIGAGIGGWPEERDRDKIASEESIRGSIGILILETSFGESILGDPGGER